MNDEIQKAPPRLMTTHNSDKEKIVAYLQGHLPRTVLSEAMERKIDRMYVCADLIRSWGTRLRVEPMLIKHIKNATGETISRQTARNIFDDTQQIFGATQKSTQQFWVDILMGQMMDTKKKAEAAEDYRAAASILKTMAYTIEKLMGSVDVSMYDRIQPAPVMIGYFPEELKVDKVLPDHELKDLVNKLMSKKRQKIYDQVDEAIVVNEQ